MGPLYRKSKGKKNLKVWKYTYYFPVAELHIWSSCQFLLLPSLANVLRNQIKEEESQTWYIRITQKTLRQEQNGWTEGKKSMIFWVRKGLSGNSSFQGHYCVEGSKSV